MRRATAILLIGVLLTVCSGAMLHVHNDHHADEAHHDEENCLLHALMRAATIADGPTPILICLGLFVAFLTMLASQPASHKVLLRLDCRGPPAHLA